MKAFKDKTGREWEIIMTLGAAKRIKEKFGADYDGADILKLETGTTPFITMLGTDPELLGMVIIELIVDQFDKHNVGEDDVLSSFDGQTLRDAQKAFYEELALFFQSGGQIHIATVVRKQMEIIERAIETVNKRVTAFDVEAEISGLVSGVSAGSSDAVPSPSH